MSGARLYLALDTGAGWLARALARAALSVGVFRATLREGLRVGVASQLRGDDAVAALRALLADEDAERPN